MFECFKYIVQIQSEYAQVVRMLGGGRVQLQCYDGVSRQGLIRGTMRRRVWINTVSEPNILVHSILNCA
jgi:initiation factor 1A